MKKSRVVMGSGVRLAGWRREAVKTLSEFGVPYAARACSRQHRSPVQAAEFERPPRLEGYGVVIAIAGKAAHLAGVLASHNAPAGDRRVPASSKEPRRAGCAPVHGADAEGLVARRHVAIDGAANAALLAVRILALGTTA